MEFGYIAPIKKDGSIGCPYVLTKGDHTIGSKIDSQIRLKLNDPLLAPLHATITVTSKGIAVLQNKSSEAPTSINDKTFTRPTSLRHKDTFQILAKQFQYFNEKLKDEPENSRLWIQEANKCQVAGRKSMPVTTLVSDVKYRLRRSFAVQRGLDVVSENCDVAENKRPSSVIGNEENVDIKLSPAKKKKRALSCSDISIKDNKKTKRNTWSHDNNGNASESSLTKTTSEAEAEINSSQDSKTMDDSDRFSRSLRISEGSPSLNEQSRTLEISIFITEAEKRAINNFDESTQEASIIETHAKLETSNDLNTFNETTQEINPAEAGESPQKASTFQDDTLPLSPSSRSVGADKENASLDSSLASTSCHQSPGSVRSGSTQSFSSFKAAEDTIEIDVVNITTATQFTPEGDEGQLHIFDEVQCTSTPFSKQFESKASKTDLSKSLDVPKAAEKRRTLRSRSLSRQMEQMFEPLNSSSKHSSKADGVLCLSYRKSLIVPITTPERPLDVEDKTPKSHVKPIRRSSRLNQAAYEDITPVTPERVLVAGFTDKTFKTPVNTPGAFESIKKQAVRSKKRGRESNGSALKDPKRTRRESSAERDSEISSDETESNSAKSPLNRLSDFEGVKKLMKTPPKSPENDLRNIPNIRSLLSPKRQNSPENDLANPLSVKTLFRSARKQKEPLNDLSDVSGVASMFNVSGVDILQQDEDTENSQDLFTKLSGKRPVRTYHSHGSFKDLNDSEKNVEDDLSCSPRVREWVDQQVTSNSRSENQSITEDDSTTDEAMLIININDNNEGKIASKEEQETPKRESEQEVDSQNSDATFNISTRTSETPEIAAAEVSANSDNVRAKKKAANKKMSEGEMPRTRARRNVANNEKVASPKITPSKEVSPALRAKRGKKTVSDAESKENSSPQVPKTRGRKRNEANAVKESTPVVAAKKAKRSTVDSKETSLTEQPTTRGRRRNAVNKENIEEMEAKEISPPVKSKRGKKKSIDPIDEESKKTSSPEKPETKKGKQKAVSQIKDTVDKEESILEDLPRTRGRKKAAAKEESVETELTPAKVTKKASSKIALAENQESALENVPKTRGRKAKTATKNIEDATESPATEEKPLPKRTRKGKTKNVVDHGETEIEKPKTRSRKNAKQNDPNETPVKETKKRGVKNKSLRENDESPQAEKLMRKSKRTAIVQTTLEKDPLDLDDIKAKAKNKIIEKVADSPRRSPRSNRGVNNNKYSAKEYETSEKAKPNGKKVCFQIDSPEKASPKRTRRGRK